MKIQVGQIVENIIQTSRGERRIVCRVIELCVAGTDMARLVDVRETRSDKWLIANNRTWAAPLENIRAHGPDCLVCHKSGLVTFS